MYPTVRERQLESAEASSMAVISRLASVPLLWVQWLIGKSVRLVIDGPRFDSKLDPSFSLSKALHQVVPVYKELSLSFLLLVASNHKPIL